MSDKYIDFEYMNTYSKKLIMLGFEKDKVCRIGSYEASGSAWVGILWYAAAGGRVH